MIVGYTTGTFDVLHRGHVSFLQRARARCDRLVVGVTIDELARRQKRQPVLAFEHRCEIVSALKSVDEVVAHSGESKEEMHSKLHFDRLFIGDDYARAEEYTGFASTHPDVRVYYLPRTVGVSTTSWIKAREDIDLIHMGVAGPILRFPGGGVIKLISVGAMEYDQSMTGTRDTYQVHPAPRNRKDLPKSTHVHPCIASVNPHREVAIAKVLQKYAWYPVTGSRVAWCAAWCAAPPEAGRSGVDLMLSERATPHCIIQLSQSCCGPSLRELLPRADQTLWRGMMQQVLLVLGDLRQEGVYHGDVHVGNICYRDGKVSLIDFGWCMHRSFDLTGEEAQHLSDALTGSTDANHFVASLYHEPGASPWHAAIASEILLRRGE